MFIYVCDWKKKEFFSMGFGNYNLVSPLLLGI